MKLPRSGKPLDREVYLIESRSRLGIAETCLTAVAEQPRCSLQLGSTELRKKVREVGACRCPKLVNARASLTIPPERCLFLVCASVPAVDTKASYDADRGPRQG